jgi:uncharacterized protein HemX
MKSLLFLLVILSGAGAGFEIYMHIQDQVNYRTKRAELTQQIADLTKQHQDLVDQNAKLSRELNEEAPAPASNAPIQPTVH